MKRINLKAIAVLVSVLTTTGIFAQNDCGSAVTVTDLTGTICATSAPSNTNALGAGSCEEGTLDTWFQFTAQGPNADFVVSNTTAGSGANQFDPEFLIVSGTPASTCAGFTELACADATGNYSTLTLTGVTGLTIGETYWVVVSSGNPTTNGTINVCVTNPIAGPCQDNEDCGSAQTFVLGAVDGGAACVLDCNTGASNGPDFAGANCFDLPNETVWFEFTTDAAMGSMDFNVLSGDLSNPEFTVFSTTDCINYVVEVCVEGSGGIAVASGVGLTPSTTYLVAVSDVGGDVGDFNLCISQFSGPPAGCTDNEDCTTPEVLALNASGAGQVCVTDCNTGATSGPDFTGNNCQDLPNATVWYEFTTAADAATIDIDLTSGDLSDPEFTIFSTTDCILFTTVYCQEGTGGSASGTTIGVDPSTTYLIAVSDATGDEGNFQLCVSQDIDGSACNTNNTLQVTGTSMGSPITGPYLPGEVVDFCYTINTFTTGLPTDPQGCNYLQGIVPQFGDCWDPVSFDGQGMPTMTLAPITVGVISDNGGCGGPPAFQDPWCPCVGDPAGTWSWYPAGSVDYNLNQTNPMGYSAGDDVGAGWFFTTAYSSTTGVCGGGSTDPDFTYGDNDFPFCNDLSGWQVCFQLQVKDATACAAGEIDCGVSVKTFADGEIGVWANIGCTADLPTTAAGALNCTTLPIELGALSGEYVNQESVINWTTISENNVSHFEIYHVVGYGDFELLGTVEAAGNSTEDIDYQFIDKRPSPGINYYNLKAVDLDGTVKNHGVVSINADFNYAYFDRSKQQIIMSHSANIEIYSLDGKLIAKSNGTTNIDFNNKGVFMIHDLSTGEMQRIVTH